MIEVLKLTENSLIVMEPGEYSVKFWVFPTCQTTGENPETLIHDDNETYPLDTWRDRFWEWRGTLKWDGCANWETNPECMMHFCEPSEAQAMADVWKTIYRLAQDNLTEACHIWETVK